MKKTWMIVRKYSPWLLAMLIMDVFFCILLWVADIRAFFILSVVLILGSVLLFTGVLLLVVRMEMKKRTAFENYVAVPNEWNEETLLNLCSRADSEMIRMLGEKFVSQQQEKEQLLIRTSDYEEYVEAWVHETKTPIFLLTMLVDNRRDEMPENINRKLDYIRNRMQEHVDQMLFYARWKGGRKDYLFEDMGLLECLQDILEDYRPLIEEKCFTTTLLVPEVSVYSDRRGLKFILNQLISNSLKYHAADTAPELMISWQEQGGRRMLSIKDNGIGVRTGDLPYIFEKGFTGDTGDSRKGATGMGLYLVQEIAADLKLSVEVWSEWKKGFEITLCFPDHCRSDQAK